MSQLMEVEVAVVNLLCLLFIFTVGWAQDESAESSESTETSVQQEENQDSQIEIEELQSYMTPFVYDKDRFRDPFESQGGAGPLSAGQTYGPFLPLQKNRLSEYKLKGLLWKTERPLAVFADPKGAEFRLEIKDYIGENFGYIASIREKEVVVIQTIEEDNKLYSTTKVLFLEK